jgi:hypothetical protein
MTTYRMRLILAGIISLDSAFKRNLDKNEQFYIKIRTFIGFLSDVIDAISTRLK